MHSNEGQPARASMFRRCAITSAEGCWTSPPRLTLAPVNGPAALGGRQ
jgi:hypothetical protein